MYCESNDNIVSGYLGFIWSNEDGYRMYKFDSVKNYALK